VQDSQPKEFEECESIRIYQSARLDRWAFELPFTCEDITVIMATSVLDNGKKSIASQHRARLAFFHTSFALKTKSVGRLIFEMEFSNQVSNFHLSFLDKEQNERTDGRFVPASGSDVDKLIETEENANTKKKTLYDINLVKQFLTEHG